MISEILMPQGGQDLTSGRIVRWLVKENEPVKSGEVICEVETEKAVFEINSPKDGYLLKILAEEDEEVEILSVIGYVGDKDDKVPEGQADVGEQEDKDVSEKTPTPSSSEIDPLSRLPRIIISPKARKLARDHQIPIESLKSSRADGKITTEVVAQVIESQSSKIPTSAKVVHPERMRKAIAKRLTESWQSTPHIFVTVDVDMTKCVEWRKKQSEKKISFNDLIIFACANAIKKFPEINVSFHDEDTIYYWDDINIGIAVSVEGGLVVPVIEDTDHLGIEEISVRSQEITEKARAGKQILSKPSRFTISNLGMYNVDSFTAVINPPEAAILAVSTIKKQPVVNDQGEIIVKDMMKMTLSLDHRVGDGVLAAEFLNEVRRILIEGKFLPD